MKPDGCYSSITNEADLRDLVYVLKEFATELGIDTETSSVDPLSCDLYGISISHQEKFAVYIPVQHHLTQPMLWDSPEEFLDLETIQKHLAPIFSDPTKTKVLHNAKFDMHVLERHGLPLAEPIYDTMIGAWILGNIHGARYGLKELVDKKLGIQMTTFKEVVGKKKDFSEVPLPEATKYAGPDADMTLRLYHKEKEVFEKYPTLAPTLELEMPIVSILQDMEKVGSRIDTSYLGSLSKPLHKEMNFYSKRIYDAWGEFNINSGEQLQEKINKYCGLALDNTQFDTIAPYVEKFPVLDSYLRYAKRLKTKGVYVDGILALVDKNERVHTEFKQNKKTGRLSSNNPNLQNIPNKKEEDEYAKDLPAIRKAFIAKPGYKIVSIDYSQVELRIMAHLANEETWIQAFNEDSDIHRATAAAMFKIPADKVTKEQRRNAKTINFGLLYLMSAFGLSKKLKISVEEAQGFIDQFFFNLHNIRKWMDQKAYEVQYRKMVETENGRRLYFHYDLDNPKSLPAAIREGTNLPIQGLAADIVKMAMIDVYGLLQNYHSKLILQIHDALDFEMKEEEMPILIPQISEIMSSAYKLKVPLKVEVEVGDNLEELHKWTN